MTESPPNIQTSDGAPLATAPAPAPNLADRLDAALEEIRADQSVAVAAPPAGAAPAPAEVTTPAETVADGDVFHVLATGTFEYLCRRDVFQWIEGPPPRTSLLALGASFQPGPVEATAILEAIRDGRIERRKKHFDSTQTPTRRLMIVESFSLGSSPTSIGAGHILEIRDTGRLHHVDGRPWGGLNAAGRVMRILSHFAVPITDSGHLLNPEHGALVPWVQSPAKLVSPGLMAAIERSPASPITQAMLRNHTKVPPPVDCLTTDAIKAWLETLPMFDPYVPAPVTPAVDNGESAAPPPPARRGTRLDEETVPFDIRVDRTIIEKVSISRTDELSGRLNIPMSVIRDGEGAIDDYIRENVDRLRVSMEGENETDWGSAVEVDRTHEVHTDPVDIIDRAQELHPHRFDENGDFID